MAKKWYCWKPLNLRKRCYLIGYCFMFAGLVNLALHSKFLVDDCCCSDLADASFIARRTDRRIDRCGPRSPSEFDIIDLPWLEPALMIINLGTHGFYPYPLLVSGKYNAYLDVTPTSKDMGCTRISLTWKFFEYTMRAMWVPLVKIYISALNNKDDRKLEGFLGVAVLNMMYVLYQEIFNWPGYSDAYQIMKVLNIVTTVLLLNTIHHYLNHIKRENQKRKMAFVKKPGGGSDDKPNDDQLKLQPPNYEAVLKDLPPKYDSVIANETKSKRDLDFVSVHLPAKPKT